MYALCATMYGSARAAFRGGDMESLPGTKMFAMIMGGLFAPVLMPIYLKNDINRGYMSKHGLKYSDYGYPEKDLLVSDILFN